MVEFLRKKLNIQKSEIVAIGDNVNDKKMIQEAGFGVAMGKSTPEVIKVADYVTSSNKEEGVAKVLQKL